jgi:hypothetical protein
VHAHQRVGCDPRLDVVRARTGLLREQCGERVRVAAEDLALVGLAEHLEGESAAELALEREREPEPGQRVDEVEGVDSTEQQQIHAGS